jgi:hypothetical protein
MLTSDSPPAVSDPLDGGGDGRVRGDVRRHRRLEQGRQRGDHDVGVPWLAIPVFQLVEVLRQHVHCSESRDEEAHVEIESNVLKRCGTL